MSDQTTLLNRVVGTWGIEEEREAFRQLFDVPATHIHAADGAANTTTANTKIWSNPFGYTVQIVGASVNPGAAVTEDSDNHATVTLLRDDGADGTPVACATVNTDAEGDGSWVADTDKAMTLTPANCVVNAGANVFYSVAKGGTGVQLPASMLKLRLRRV